VLVRLNVREYARFERGGFEGGEGGDDKNSISQVFSTQNITRLWQRYVLDVSGIRIHRAGMARFSVQNRIQNGLQKALSN
jgi:hypothetical protein